MNLPLSEINNAVQNDCAKFIKNSNNSYINRLTEVADRIAQNREERPVILLSGPSGSGKTTTALMLGKILDSIGCKTHILSMDNYFTPLTDREKQLLSEGKMDLESPARMDSEFLTSQLRSVCNCEPVELPAYSFSDSRRMKSGKILHRLPGELVILEGIHALNPDVVELPDDSTAKIYVSVRTRITDGNITLHPSKIRLLRRLVRDSKFRKRTLRETTLMFHSVEEGENKYIMPYKYRSTYDIDTFFAYEAGVYKTELFQGLSELSGYPELSDTLEVLSDTVPVQPENVPPDSLICEFIGNGIFSY